MTEGGWHGGVLVMSDSLGHSVVFNSCMGGGACHVR